MKDQVLGPEEAKKIMETKGQVKGAVFQTDAEYIKRKWGPEGLKKVEGKMRDMGYPIVYERAKAMEWYPLGLRLLSLLATKESFNLNDKDINHMGNTAPKLSFIIKLILKSFVSVEVAFARAPDMWTKHYSVGKLESEFHGKEKYGWIFLNEIELHPIFRRYLEGYFRRIAQFALGEDADCVTPDKPPSGDKQHVFKIIWP